MTVPYNIPLVRDGSFYCRVNLPSSDASLGGCIGPKIRQYRLKVIGLIMELFNKAVRVHCILNGQPKTTFLNKSDCRKWLKGEDIYRDTAVHVRNTFTRIFLDRTALDVALRDYLRAVPGNLLQRRVSNNSAVSMLRPEVRPTPLINPSSDEVLWRYLAVENNLADPIGWAMEHIRRDKYMKAGTREHSTSSMLGQERSKSDPTSKANSPGHSDADADLTPPLADKPVVVSPVVASSAPAQAK